MADTWHGHPHGAEEARARDGSPRGSVALDLVADLGLYLGALSILVIFGQFVLVDLSIGPSNVATPAEEVRYLVTAAVCFALLLSGTVAAYLVRRRGLTGGGVVLLVLATGVAVLFPVPSDRWVIEAPAPTPEPDRPICRSGGDSSDCPGG